MRRRDRSLDTTEAAEAAAFLAARDAFHDWRLARLEILVTPERTAFGLSQVARNRVVADLSSDSRDPDQPPSLWRIETDTAERVSTASLLESQYEIVQVTARARDGLILLEIDGGTLTLLCARLRIAPLPAA